MPRASPGVRVRTPRSPCRRNARSALAPARRWRSLVTKDGHNRSHQYERGHGRTGAVHRASDVEIVGRGVVTRNEPVEPLAPQVGVKRFNALVIPDICRSHKPYPYFISGIGGVGDRTHAHAKSAWSAANLVRRLSHVSRSGLTIPDELERARGIELAIATPYASSVTSLLLDHEARSTREPPAGLGRAAPSWRADVVAEEEIRTRVVEVGMGGLDVGQCGKGDGRQDDTYCHGGEGPRHHSGRREPGSHPHYDRRQRRGASAESGRRHRCQQPARLAKTEPPGRQRALPAPRRRQRRHGMRGREPGAGQSRSR